MFNRRSVFAGMLAVGLAMPLAARSEPLEKPNLTVAIGTWTFAYLPLIVAQTEGMFRDEGLNVTIQNFNAGGSRAVQALIGGSTDTVVGYYDHTIQLQSQHKYIRCVVLLDRLAGPVLEVRSELRPQIHDVADLKGHRIGISAFGSSIEFQLRYLMSRAGLHPEDYTVLPIGTDASAVAAVEHKQVDALVTSDPGATFMQQRNLVQPLVDSRTDAGSTQAFGGPYPTACLYATQPFIDGNPHTMQHLVNAFVKALRWLHTHTPEEITKAVPAEYELNDPAMFQTVVRNSADLFSQTGTISAEDARRVLSIFASYDPRIAQAHIDLDRTYTNDFVKAAAP